MKILSNISFLIIGCRFSMTNDSNRRILLKYNVMWYMAKFQWILHNQIFYNHPINTSIKSLSRDAHAYSSLRYKSRTHKVCILTKIWRQWTSSRSLNLAKRKIICAYNFFVLVLVSADRWWYLWLQCEYCYHSSHHQ